MAWRKKKKKKYTNNKKKTCKNTQTCLLWNRLFMEWPPITNARERDWISTSRIPLLEYQRLSIVKSAIQNVYTRYTRTNNKFKTLTILYRLIALGSLEWIFPDILP